HQRRQEHAANQAGERARLDLFHHSQLLRAETHHFDIEVIVNKFQLLTQSKEGLRLAQKAAQNVGQLHDEQPGSIGFHPHQRRNGIQRVEKKMRIDLALQRLHARLQQQTLMLFQLQLHPRRVPDFQRDSHRRYRSGIHGYQWQPGSGVYIEYLTVRPPADFYPRHLQQHNHPEERGLPVNLRMTQHLADPAVNAEINEWREGPDLFTVSSGVAQHPGDESHRQIERQRGVFSMHQ